MSIRDWFFKKPLWRVKIDDGRVITVDDMGRRISHEWQVERIALDLYWVYVRAANPKEAAQVALDYLAELRAMKPAIPTPDAPRSEAP